MPFVHYDGLVHKFVMEFIQFSSNHPEYQLTKYHSILENNGIEWNDRAIREANVNSLDAQCILALIQGGIRAERVSEGTLLSLFKEEFILKWLKRLEDIDDVASAHKG
ncbi:DUF6508 domain-containing protein [Niallia sp. Krafla_26]|uniref:DUF6508 domain-containing protein n=1 Tax=Niallia sp. Krafla_26 TaxID=3064703 RepID=UPI003D186248